MSVVTPAERAYLQSQQLGRLATVGLDGQPHVVPVEFRHNLELDTIDIGVHGIARSKKYRDVARNGRAAFVVDDIVSSAPLQARGIEVRGQAIALPTGGQEIHPGFEAGVIRITPHRIAAWGIDDADPFRSNRRTVS